MKTTRKPPRALFLIALCAPLFYFPGCGSDSRITDGNSSETTNVAIVTRDNKPASFSEVKLIDSRNWLSLVSKNRSVVLARVMADKNGVAAFDSFPSTACNLQIDHRDGGLVIRDFTTGAVSEPVEKTVRLQSYARLRALVPAQSPGAQLLSLEGTDYKGILDENGTFVFPALAPGDYQLLAQTLEGQLNAAGSLSAAASESITDTVAVSFDRVLVDDFEDMDFLSALGKITRGYWYPFSDRLVGGESQISWATLPDDSSRYAARVDIVLDGGEFAWAGIGTGLGAVGTEWDLSAMSALSFRAKGYGSIRVSVESAITDSLAVWPDFGAPVTLDSAWQKFTIPVDSLRLPPAPNRPEITWNEVADRVLRIEFEAAAYHASRDTIRLWLDDIYLEGVSLSQIVK